MTSLDVSEIIGNVSENRSMNFFCTATLSALTPTTRAFNDSSSAVCFWKSSASWHQPGVFARG